jgi:hypothetical protein
MLVWSFLKKAKIELSYDLSIPLQGIHLWECKSGYNSDIYKLVFISALFTIAKLWNQPRCPSMDK